MFIECVEWGLRLGLRCSAEVEPWGLGFENVGLDIHTYIYLLSACMVGIGIGTASSLGLWVVGS